MKPSDHDDILTTSKCIEIGLTIKDWSKDKSLRDMHSVLPDYEESGNFNKYYSFVEAQSHVDPLSVVTIE